MGVLETCSACERELSFPATCSDCGAGPLCYRCYLRMRRRTDIPLDVPDKIKRNHALCLSCHNADIAVATLKRLTT